MPDDNRSNIMRDPRGKIQLLKSLMDAFPEYVHDKCVGLYREEMFMQKKRVLCEKRG
jgi:hypothetical protein